MPHSHRPLVGLTSVSRVWKHTQDLEYDKHNYVGSVKIIALSCDLSYIKIVSPTQRVVKSLVEI